VSLSGADPLNLIGILTPGQRLSALTANRVVYRHGLPVAALVSGKAQFLTDLAPADQWGSRSGSSGRRRAAGSPTSSERGYRGQALACTLPRGRRVSGFR